jgi:hypothetical protein
VYKVASRIANGSLMRAELEENRVNAAVRVYMGVLLVSPAASPQMQRSLCLSVLPSRRAPPAECAALLMATWTTPSCATSIWAARPL